MGLEELKVVYLHPKAERRRLASGKLGGSPLKAPPSTVTHFLQQCHTYSNKARPPNPSNPLQTVGSYLNEFIFRDKAKGIQMPTLINTDTPRTCCTSLYHTRGNQGQDVLWVRGPGAVIRDQPLSRPQAFPWVLFCLSVLRSCRLWNGGRVSSFCEEYVTGC